MQDFFVDEQGVREPVVAGQFYPVQPDALRTAIREAFQSPLGPGAVPQAQPGPRQLIGLVVPHAGYPYSGPGAAWAYAALAHDGQPGTVVLLGVNHRLRGAPLALSPATSWRTPLGTVPVATELGARLRQRCPALALDAAAHTAEHSLEVQVPFLQFLFGAVPVLPIALGNPAIAEVFALGEALAALAWEEDLLLVASTDFSHYVAQAAAERLDGLALARIAALDPEGLLEVVRSQGITMCGVLPVAVLLAAARQLGAHAAEVLHYHTSGDVLGDYAQVVGYGAVAVRR